MDARLTALRVHMERWLNAHPDEDVLRWLFRVVLTAAVIVLVIDYALLGSAGVRPELGSAAPAPNAPIEASPVWLPSVEPAPSDRGGEKSRRAPLRRPDAQLQARMTFDLRADGRLLATGMIHPGTAKDFAAEVTKRGGYIKTVVLHSPGGSLHDALAMGRLIREKRFATEVEAGRYCASACPLAFAGGVERRASPKASIGVHRAVTMSPSGPVSTADGMEEGQRVSALCAKYLREMGVDLQVWVHAMETPKDELYYFRPEELTALKLATVAGESRPVAAARAK